MNAYLRLLALFLAVLAAALAGFNFLLDPYGYFGAPRIAGVNERALGFNHRLLLAKALAVSRMRPASIVLGNSRAEAGYDPQHPGITERPAYNLAIGGSGLGQIRRYFLEALNAGGLRHVILALDYTMFDGAPVAQDASLETLLLTDHAGAPASGREWRRLAFILLSGTASSDSWWSLTHQRKPVAVYGPTGLRDEAYDIDQVAREGGARRASARVESGFLAAMAQDAAGEGYRTTLGELQEIIALSAARDMRLTLIVNPIHARQTYLIASAGRWPQYENWKRDLIAARQRSPRPERVALWDFSGIGACTGESLPAEANANAAMRWYRESSHFRLALGNRVFDRVFGRPDDGACGEFGQRLEDSTLASTLSAQRAALERWTASHPNDVAEVDRLARQYGPGAAGR